MGAEIVALVSDLAKVKPRIIVVMSQSLDKRLAERQKEPSTLPARLTPIQISSTEVPKINSEFNKTLSIAYEKLPQEEFKTTILRSIKSYYKNCYLDKRSYFLQHQHQAHVTSFVALAFLVIGALIMIASITLIFFNNHLIGTIAAVTSIISEALGVLFLGFNKLLNDRLDETAKNLSILARTHDAISHIDQIMNPERKGKALEELLRKILKDITSK